MFWRGSGSGRSGRIRDWFGWGLKGCNAGRGRSRLARRAFRRLAVERLEDRSLLAATLLGAVWHDLNSDGQQTGGEPAMQYAVAELFSSANGTIGDSDDVSLGTQITDSAGNYQFTGLAPGVSHYVVIRPPVGFAFTVQDTGPDATDSDVGATGVSAMFAPVDLSTVDLDAGLTGAAPAFGWAAQQGGAGHDEGYSVAVDAAGASYVTGSFRNTADFDSGPGTYHLTSAGSDEIYVAKYTPGGALVWARRVGGTSSDIGYGMAVDASSNVLVTGYFQGTADFDPGAGTASLTSAGSHDVFALKLDTAGNFIWARRVGSTSSDYGRGVAVDSSGNILVTGAFMGTVDFDPDAGATNLTSTGGYDVFVWKLTATGDLAWAASAGGTTDDRSQSVAVDSSGNVLITGSFMGTVDFDPGAGTANLTSAGSDDAFVLKLSAAGNYVWAGRVGGTSSDYGGGVAVDSSGNVLVAGHFQGTADFDPGAGTANLTSAGGFDAFVLKLNGSGNYVWAAQVGGTGRDHGYGVAVDASGNVLVTGSFEGTADFDPGPGTLKLTSLSFGSIGDVFVLKLDPAGNHVWARRAGGADVDAGYGIAVDGAGNVLVTGYFRSVVDFDPGAGKIYLTGSGTNDEGFAWRINAAGFAPPIPRVTDVFVRGTGDGSGTGNDEWLAAYLTHLGAVGLGDSALGYRVSVGADQLDTLPWTNVDTVSIRFSEGVVINTSLLQVFGAVEGPTVPGLTVFTTYNPTTFTATWRFTAALPANKYLLHFGDGAIVGLDSFALDGEWTDGVSTVSGNGTAGGAFSFRMNVVPGDVNGDTVTSQSVTNADVLLTKQRFGTDTSDGASYAYRRDVNGSGFITNPDVLLIKQQQSLGTSIFDYSEPVPPSPGESLGEESFAAARLAEPWHTDSALAEPVPPEGTIDLEAWDAAILAMYGKKK